MRFKPTDVFGATLIDPDSHRTIEAGLLRVWCARDFVQCRIDFTPVQANMWYSARKGKIRGTHFQEEPAFEAKLVRSTRGAMFDVVLDLRTESPSYCKWYGTELLANNGRMLYVPEHCAHGYQTL
jgi:dTDP-4-dehydrorhamnose 3,5-epimerase